MTCNLCHNPMKWGKYAEQKEKATGICPDCLHKPFPITSVCRADMIARFPPAKIGQLDDGEMAYIARKMADAYCDEVFWIDLDILAEHVLEEKARETTG